MELKKLVSLLTKPFARASDKPKPEPVLGKLPPENPKDCTLKAFYKGYNAGDPP